MATRRNNAPREILGIRLKASDMGWLEGMARQQGKSASAWARELILAEMDRIRGVPNGRKLSWANLEMEKRTELGKAWAPHVPLPAWFKDLDAAAKVAWLDTHWPLDRKPPANGAAVELYPRPSHDLKLVDPDGTTRIITVAEQKQAMKRSFPDMNTPVLQAAPAEKAQEDEW